MQRALEGGWQLVDCLELIDLDLPMVVQLVERKSVSYSQPVDYLEPVDWLPLAEQDLVSYSQPADYLELVG